MPDKYESLQIPPAMEAVIDVSIGGVDHLLAEAVSVYDPEFLKKYPIKEELKAFEGSMDLMGINAPKVSNRTIGQIYKSEDNKEVSQFRTNGFTYSRLGNYPGWNDFFSSFLTNFQIYKNLVPYAVIKRIGVRFINVIDIQGFQNNYSDYFHVYLNSDDSFGGINQYQYRYLKEFPDCGMGVMVNFSPDSSFINGANAKFILDIDVIKPDLNQPISTYDISSELAHMRTCKNKVFFGTIKEKLLEKYR